MQFSIWNLGTDHSELVETARTQIGYRAQPNRESLYGRTARYRGAPWNGSFVDQMLEEAGLRETSLISTVNALQYFVQRGRLKTVRAPKVGDLVFYGFATNGLYPMEQPHVGIVSDVTRFKLDGTFRAIEGETGTGSSKGSQEVDGVFERMRSRADVIGYVTPRKKRATAKPHDPEDLKNLPKLRASYFASNPKTRSNAVKVLQIALSQTSDRTGFTSGVFDTYTQSVLDEFRRQVGLLGKSGPPDTVDLRALDRATNGTVFRMEE